MKKKYRLNKTQFAAFLFVTLIIILTTILVVLMIINIIQHPEQVLTTY